MGRRREPTRYQAFRSGVAQNITGSSIDDCWRRLIQGYGPDVDRNFLKGMGWTVKRAD